MRRNNLLDSAAQRNWTAHFDGPSPPRPPWDSPTRRTGVESAREAHVSAQDPQGDHIELVLPNGRVPADLDTRAAPHVNTGPLRLEAGIPPDSGFPYACAAGLKYRGLNGAPRNRDGSVLMIEPNPT